MSPTESGDSDRSQVPLPVSDMWNARRHPLVVDRRLWIALWVSVWLGFIAAVLRAVAG